MDRSTFESFENAVTSARNGGQSKIVVPIFRRLSADLLTPVAAYLKLCEGSKYSFLFESVEGGEQLARYSFLGKDPYRVLRAYGSDVFADHFEDGKPVPSIDGSIGGNILEVLRDTLGEWHEIKNPELPRLTCGAVGYLGYETVRLIEKLPTRKDSDLTTPDAVWCMYDSILAFDHVRHQIVLISNAFVSDETDLQASFDRASARLDEIEKALREPVLKPPPKVSVDTETPDSEYAESEYMSAVEKAREYIREGDIFQVVLSRRFSFPLSGHPFNLYRALRQVNPSPYLFYLQLDDFQLVGSSPEVLVSVEDGNVQVLPIAGTRPRGRNIEEDIEFEKELREDHKENAEHLMLVDLGRNDVGRISEYGSVTVDQFASIERYSHVMHLVSRVSGRLDSRFGAVDALSACFPAGTVSGAPKVRAMEIINELEPVARGTYAGAVGYLDFSGNMDTCIAIRTMLVENGTIYIQAGAGIVADSDPLSEFVETENKAGALLEAIKVASDDLL
ncbi:MAG: anthranilate synthase component I [Rhodothermales bacterium]|nr:anthranilate synthase component I [Rhodothermales bacterium]